MDNSKLLLAYIQLYVDKSLLWIPDLLKNIYYSHLRSGKRSLLIRFYKREIFWLKLYMKFICEVYEELTSSVFWSTLYSVSIKFYLIYLLIWADLPSLLSAFMYVCSSLVSMQDLKDGDPTNQLLKPCWILRSWYIFFLPHMLCKDVLRMLLIYKNRLSYACVYGCLWWINTCSGVNMELL